MLVCINCWLLCISCSKYGNVALDIDDVIAVIDFRVQKAKNTHACVVRFASFRFVCLSTNFILFQSFMERIVAQVYLRMTFAYDVGVVGVMGVWVNYEEEATHS